MERLKAVEVLMEELEHALMSMQALQCLDNWSGKKCWEAARNSRPDNGGEGASYCELAV
jgi:hypothetical protein